MTAPATRRILTGHDAGKAVVLQDGAAPNVKHREASGVFSTLLWTAGQTPASNDGDEDCGNRVVGTAPPPGGSVFRIVDFPPAHLVPQNADNAAVLREMGIADASASASRSAFMHRTRSIDYAIVLSGEIAMLLDDSEVMMSAGDVLVQRGTNHAWVNRSADWCRVAFVLIDALPLDV